MNIRRMKALVFKEALQVVRDPSAILVAFILPLILLFLMGYAVSLDAKKISIAIVSKNDNAASKALIQAFVYSKSFHAEVGTTSDIYLDKMAQGTVRAILQFHDNFGKNGNYEIQILADGSEPNTAGMVQNYASGVIRLWALDINKESQKNIQLDSRYWFNPPVSSRYFLLPGSIAVVMTLIGTLLTALVIAREWERGTMEALMATPASMVEILFGKIIPYFLLGMGSMLLCFLVAYYWYEIPFEGSFLLLFLLSAIYLFPTLSIGLLISTLAKNQFVAGLVSIVIGFLPAFILSGFLFEISNMPNGLQIVTQIIPARYFVESLQTIFLAGNVYPILIKDAICMLVIGIVLFGVIIKKTKKGI